MKSSERHAAKGSLFKQPQYILYHALFGELTLIVIPYYSVTYAQQKITLLFHFK